MPKVSRESPPFVSSIVSREMSPILQTESPTTVQKGSSQCNHEKGHLWYQANVHLWYQEKGHI